MALNRRASELAEQNWSLSLTSEAADGSVTLSIDRIQCVLLQEIRDELKALNAVMHCNNTLKIPRELSGLRRDVKALAKALAEKT